MASGRSRGLRSGELRRWCSGIAVAAVTSVPASAGAVQSAQPAQSLPDSRAALPLLGEEPISPEAALAAGWPLCAVRGVVVDSRRLPVVGVPVTLRQRIEDGTQLETRAQSKEGGVFELLAIDTDAIDAMHSEGRELRAMATAGPLAMRSSLLLAQAASGEVALGALPYSDEWQPPQRPRVLSAPMVLQAAARPLVRVEAGGAPIAGATVIFRTTWGRLEVVRGMTGANGGAVMPPMPVLERLDGFEWLAIHPEQGAAIVSAARGPAAGVSADADEASSDGARRLELRPFRRLQLEVVDVDRGRPVGGASVHLSQVVARQDGRGEEMIPLLTRLDRSCTGEDGRIELIGLPSDLVLAAGASAPRHATRWLREPNSTCGTFDPWATSDRVVASDVVFAQVELKRLAPRVVRHPLRATKDGSVAAPADGSRLRIGRHPAQPHRRHYESPQCPTPEVMVRDGAVEFVCLLDPAVHRLPALWELIDPEALLWFPDGRAARLPAEQGAEIEFDATSSLEVVARSAKGQPLALAAVELHRETAARSQGRDEERLLAWTNADGIVRFDALLPDLVAVHVAGCERLVELPHSIGRVTLSEPESVELCLDFTVDGERRLPANCSVGFAGASLRQLGAAVAEPQLGRMRFWFTRPDPAAIARHGCDGEARVWLDDGRSFVYRLPQLPSAASATVAITVPPTDRGAAIVHVVGSKDASGSVILRAHESDPKNSGRHLRIGSLAEPTSDGGRLTARFDDLEPGTWRATSSEGLSSAPFEVVAGAPPVEITFDHSRLSKLPVEWRAPKGESVAFAELLVEPDGFRVDPWWFHEQGWPYQPGLPTTTRFVFDSASPPALRIRHPYLVTSAWNRAIDLANPRSKLTLHLEVGPLFEWTPRFAAGTRPMEGAVVRRAPAGAERAALLAAPRERALRRGDRVAMAPPAAGEWRVLIDPLVAAPVEFERLSLDGGPRDLGEITFPRGSTLRVRATVPAGFALPHLAASAERIDGLPYERSVLPLLPERRAHDPAAEPAPPPVPGECAIRGLGKGRFRVFCSASGMEWRAAAPIEIELDGASDAEVNFELE